MIFFRSRCYNGGQRHDFRPRITEHFRPYPINLGGGASLTSEALTAMLSWGERKYTYHGDVCAWCGKVVNKPGEA